jgi:hypothetical protein
MLSQWRTCGKYHATIGSQIKRLYVLGNYRTYNGLLDELTKRSRRIHLRELYFHRKRFDASLPQAYCERNIFFARLLQDPDDSASESSSESEQNLESLYPTFFQVAKQVPSMKLPVVLQSIMVLDQSVGAIRPGEHSTGRFSTS